MKVWFEYGVSWEIVYSGLGSWKSVCGGCEWYGLDLYEGDLRIVMGVDLESEFINGGVGNIIVCCEMRFVDYEYRC